VRLITTVRHIVTRWHHNLTLRLTLTLALTLTVKVTISYTVKHDTETKQQLVLHNKVISLGTTVGL